MTTLVRPAITRDPEIHSGAAVFTGTRVAVRILLDYLAEGQTIEEFLRHYPSVSREQTVRALEEIEGLLDEPS